MIVCLCGLWRCLGTWRAARNTSAGVVPCLMAVLQVSRVLAWGKNHVVLKQSNLRSNHSLLVTSACCVQRSLSQQQQQHPLLSAASAVYTLRLVPLLSICIHETA